ncbi:hypothetical protein ACIRQY_19950 [Streptomyces sp. NPDC101490]|uniref:hypothetical protein n=1 Tax=unclassified Streptomyces TaxID=2593676 RepID=UPI00331E4B4F
MDLFDVEPGGRDEHHSPGGGGCSWVTLVLLGIAVGAAFLMFWFFDFVRSLF